MPRPDAGDVLNQSTRVIAYHPELARLTGSVTSAILAQQCWFWWDNHRKDEYNEQEDM